MYQGVIKTYFDAKGFGFIESDSVQGDVMFSHTELPEDAKNCFGRMMQGRNVQFAMKRQEDGRNKATQVTLLAGEGDTLTGEVKFYSEAKTYGFVTSSSLTEDCRFNQSDLPPGVMPYPGLKVTFKVVTLPDGKMRVKELRSQDRKGGGKGKGMPGGMMMQGGYGGYPASPAAYQQTGVVKLYIPPKGFGFINAPGVPGDIKFGKSDIAPWCQEQINQGSSVSFQLVQSPKGMQAVGVEMVQGMAYGNGGGKGYGGKAAAYGLPPPAYGGKGNGFAKGMGPPAKKRRVQETATGEWSSGTIKNFKNGFGFITNETGDFFFMKEALPADAQAKAESLIGHTVSFELVRTQDGKMRAKNIQDIQSGEMSW